MSQLPFYKLRVVANILTLHRYLVQSINANGSAKNRACGHKLHPATQVVISQYWNRIFVSYSKLNAENCILGVDRILLTTIRLLLLTFSLLL